MQAATHSDGRLLDYDAEAREFTLGDVPLSPSDVLALDKARALTWTRLDVRSVLQKSVKRGKPMGDLPMWKGSPSEGGTRVVTETRYTCKSCGNVWHWGKQDQTQNTLNAVANVGDSMSCCSCCFPTPQRKVVDPSKCPKCGSRASEKETVVHEVE